MRRREVLAVIQAGGSGSRMDVLTRERPKPALPVAGMFQLLDFPLTNLSHSGVSEVWLSVQYHGAALEEQVANGRPWDLDHNRGGLRLLIPEEGTGSADEDGFARGNADELFRIRDQLRAARPGVVVVMSADHVYRMDFAELARTHLERGDECTVVTTEVPVAEAGDHTTLVLDRDRVIDMAYKPATPHGGTVSAEIVAYQPDVLIEVLEELHRELGGDAAPGDTGLGDYGEHLLPRMVRRHRTGAHRLHGYWRDLGRPGRYLSAHRDLLRDDLGIFGDPEWPILTRTAPGPPPRLLAGCDVVDSLISPGCVVEGRVVRSVLGPGVRVHPGAMVVDSVLFADCVVEEGASVAVSVVDTGCRLGTGSQVGAQDAAPDDDEQITLLGRDSVVAPGAQVAAGSRLEPGSTAGDPDLLVDGEPRNVLRREDR